MQTKEQCLEKVYEMTGQLQAHIMKKAKQLLNSGAVDVEGYEDDYRLPKILLVACLEHEADGWRPLKENKKARREIANLRHF